MVGSVLVPFPEARDVFIDNGKCGVTNIPFDVEVGTHDIDLGLPADYNPPTRQIRVKSTNTPLAPLIVKFTLGGGVL
jgi:hypothetical protein